ncbi:hypothetical protein PHYC_01934 [Phycisphaerales bacterium]|nr:hypothetical protein PHYC_01934 [Phycisphaerales bacterium]
MRGANLWQIIGDHFCPFSFKGQRRSFSAANAVYFAVAPGCAGYVLLRYAGPISESGNDIYLTVFAVVGAVFTALLTVVQSVVGGTDKATPYDAAARIRESQRSIRLEVLRELYASIAFAVLFLVLSAVPIMALDYAPLPHAWRAIASAFTYGVAVLMAFTFLHIISGVYLVLDAQAKETSDRLKDLERRSTTDGPPSAQGGAKPD